MTPEAEKLRKQNIKIIGEAVLTIEYCRKQQYFYGMRHSALTINALMDGMGDLLQMLPVVNGENPFINAESILSMIQELQGAQEEEDYVLLADLLEASLIPVFLTCQQRLTAQEQVFVDEFMLRDNVTALERRIPGITQVLFRYEVQAEYSQEGWLSDAGFQAVLTALQKVFQKGYAVEFTSGGEYTAAVPGKRKKTYLHTNNLMAKESISLAYEWLLQGKESYLFYGLGFGYPYEQMLLMDENITITVTEGNMDILLLAVVFSPLASLLNNPRFRLEMDITGRRLFSLVEEHPESGCYIHYPSLKGIRSQRYRQKLEEYYISESSIRTQKGRLDSNFKKNQQMQVDSIWKLKDQFAGRDLYIIAAGPSLDKNMEELRKIEHREDSVVLATGTVLKKLLNAGIRPDYVIITDAGGSVCQQTAGEEECGIPLLFLSTVNSRLLENYAGEKYRIYQEDYVLACQATDKSGEECFETGGSVSTTAMEVGIRLQCRRIIFVGLDLAFTNGKNHAEHTASVREVSGVTTYQVESVDGGMVDTARNLNIYREWIENRIQKMRRDSDDRLVIDATEGGAKKAGMKVMTLDQAINCL